MSSYSSTSGWINGWLNFELAAIIARKHNDSSRYYHQDTDTNLFEN